MNKYVDQKWKLLYQPIADSVSQREKQIYTE